MLPDLLPSIYLVCLMVLDALLRVVRNMFSPGPQVVGLLHKLEPSGRVTCAPTGTHPLLASWWWYKWEAAYTSGRPCEPPITRLPVPRAFTTYVWQIASVQYQSDVTSTHMQGVKSEAFLLVHSLCSPTAIIRPWTLSPIVYTIMIHYPALLYANLFATSFGASLVLSANYVVERYWLWFQEQILGLPPASETDSYQAAQDLEQDE